MTNHLSRYIFSIGTLLIKNPIYYVWTLIPSGNGLVCNLKWVPRRPGLTIESGGHGGKPSLDDIYLKMPDGLTFVENTPLDFDSDKVLIGAPLQITRIGNLKGEFGVSMLHGQASGYKVYKLIPIVEYTPSGLIKMYKNVLSSSKTQLSLILREVLGWSRGVARALPDTSGERGVGRPEEEVAAVEEAPLAPVLVESINYEEFTKDLEHVVALADYLDDLASGSTESSYYAFSVLHLPEDEEWLETIPTRIPGWRENINNFVEKYASIIPIVYIQDEDGIHPCEWTTINDIRRCINSANYHPDRIIDGIIFAGLHNGYPLLEASLD